MRTSHRHHNVVDGVGKCSVPMWVGGCPAGFCDKDAYGKSPPSRTYRNAWTGEVRREDRRYNGFAAGLLCPIHGGPRLPEVAHKGDPCECCGAPRDEVEPGPCPVALERFEKGVAP